ncbi:MAG: tRNA preQ1(34) S-adenosylmethionine ribosyltransferase-isomerase QueA [Clostridiales bacterium]|jgi:S-adenosylmethionine:tRNA ribosyltransferase-isomerase|nr:tRNA preQ1(34) S-adenosylmethionine ribosyltransferase-isomerase QueA [Clostridiales bacterium]
MLTSEFDYFLPTELIAQTPIEPRDASRLFVYDRKENTIKHEVFRNLPEYINAGEVLVINNTKVMPARLHGVLNGSAKAEVLLLKRLDYKTFETVMRPAKKARVSSKIVFSDNLSATVTGFFDGGIRTLEFDFDGVFEDILREYGEMPLPHYIKEKLADKSRYQTVYGKNDGSAAAPTAGLHFTEGLLDSLRAKGVIIAELLLHVGLGTFRPVNSERVEDHKMHSEYYEIGEEAADAINAAKKEGRKIIAVGTTSVRTLESAADEDGYLKAGSGETDIFIYPPYKFKIADAVITNFHLPKSSLIMLVSAFAGYENTMRLYKTAVEERYRFFSFGDAMLIR